MATVSLTSCIPPPHFRGGVGAAILRRLSVSAAQGSLSATLSMPAAIGHDGGDKRHDDFCKYIYEKFLPHDLDEFLAPMGTLLMSKKERYKP